MLNEQTLVEKIHQIMKEEFKTTNHDRRLRKIVVRCDMIEDLDNARVNVLWRQVAVEPVFQSSHIEIHHDPPFGRCLVCNQEFELSDETARCPFCHCVQFKVIHEVSTIESYEMEPE